MVLNRSIIFYFLLTFLFVICTNGKSLVRPKVFLDADATDLDQIKVINKRTDKRLERRRRADNTPPIVTSPPAMKLTGKGDFTITLFAQDREGDNFEFFLDESKPKPKYGNVTLTKQGELTYSTKTNDTGEDKIHFIVKEVYSNDGTSLLETQSVLTLQLTERQQAMSITPLGKPTIPTVAPPTLKKWEIAAIIAGGALFLTLMIIGVTCCCCTFEPGNSRLPKNSPFGNHVMPMERRPSSMNPHYKPPRSSLLKRESVRCGAADGVPYYGTRKNNMWTPKPDDVPLKRDSYVITPSPSMQSELFVTSPPRRPSIQTIHESPRNSVHTIPENFQPRESPTTSTPKKSFPQIKLEPSTAELLNQRRSSCLSENMSVFAQVPWSSISSPSAQ